MLAVYARSLDAGVLSGAQQSSRFAVSGGKSGAGAMKKAVFVVGSSCLLCSLLLLLLTSGTSRAAEEDNRDCFLAPESSWRSVRVRNILLGDGRLPYF